MNLYSIDQNYHSYKIDGTVVHNVRLVHLHLGTNCQLIDYSGGGPRNLGCLLSDDIALQVAKRDFQGNIYACPYCMARYWR
ncbi:MAG TPA: hypothetical protein VJY54_01965 [Lachnospiraceae bacterium]|nr:hypothetical protein [Lachnospiraceae bacterium]